MTRLGRIDDLPTDYVQGFRSRNTLPLWPALRTMLPYGAPMRRTLPVLWRYREIRPDLLRAGDLTPIEKAGRIGAEPSTHAVRDPLCRRGVGRIHPGRGREIADGARAPYPLLRFRWREVREALGELARVTAAARQPRCCVGSTPTAASLHAAEVIAGETGCCIRLQTRQGSLRC